MGGDDEAQDEGGGESGVRNVEINVGHAGLTSYDPKTTSPIEINKL